MSEQVTVDAIMKAQDHTTISYTYALEDGRVIWVSYFEHVGSGNGCWTHYFPRRAA